MVKYRNYEQLHEHPGNNKYVVKKVYTEEYEIREVLLDKKKSDLFIYAKTNPIKKEERIYTRRKVSLTGIRRDEGPTYRILKDGTMWRSTFYCNWIINGDTSKHSYIRPLTKKEEKDPDKWIEVFRDLYSKASSVYIYEGLGEYYFKVEKEWYKLGYNEEADNAFNERFPAKFDNVRMIELEDRTPDFSRGPTQRDTSLWTYHGYEEADSESGSGLNPINFSAGWHYLQLKMPGSEPLKIARYGSMGVNMHTYIIPDSLGGREGVVFIVQEPSELYPGREHGGMYVVRPRELGEE